MYGHHPDLARIHEVKLDDDSWMDGNKYHPDCDGITQTYVDYEVSMAKSTVPSAFKAMRGRIVFPIRDEDPDSLFRRLGKRAFRTIVAESQLTGHLQALNAKAGKETFPFRSGTRANANQHRVDETPLPTLRSKQTTKQTCSLV